MKELEIARENEAAIEAMQSELKENYQKQKMNLVREHELLLDNVRQQHAFGLENLRVEFKNEEEALRKFHADRLDEIRMKLTAIETKKLDLSENQKPEVNDTRYCGCRFFECIRLNLIVHQKRSYQQDLRKGPV